VFPPHSPECFGCLIYQLDRRRKPNDVLASTLRLSFDNRRYRGTRLASPSRKREQRPTAGAYEVDHLDADSSLVIEQCGTKCVTNEAHVSSQGAIPLVVLGLVNYASYTFGFENPRESVNDLESKMPRSFSPLAICHRPSFAHTALKRCSNSERATSRSNSSSRAFRMRPPAES
jgi:hypothetical protein